MKVRNIYKVALLLLALCTASQSSAQSEKNRYNPVYSSVASLSIAPDARGGGLGDVGAATEADVYSQYWNPAKYPFNIARAGAAISYTPWLRKLVTDINLANLTGFYRIGDYSAVHGSLRYFSLGDVYMADMEDMTIRPYEMAIDAGYSRMLSQCLSMAVNMRFILSDLKFDYTAESSPGKAFAADIALYRLGYFMAGNRECSFGWGLNLSNIGSKITYGGSTRSEFIPTNLRLGINLTIPFNEYNKFSIAADANKLLIPTIPIQDTENNESGTEYDARVEKDYYEVSSIAGIFKSFSDAPGGFKEEMEEIQLSFGCEYTYNDRFMLRAGYHHEAENKGNRKYFTVGAGFHMSVFTIDASYVFSTAQTNPLDQTMRFSLGFDLDGMRDLFGRRR